MSKTAGETNLDILLKNMKPFLNEGDYVFCTIHKQELLTLDDVLLFFKEKEADTIIVKKEFADKNMLTCSSVMAWITLTVHSSLEAVGLTAAFSTALAKEEISCNVIAGFCHDHIFIPKKDVSKAMNILNRFAEN